MTTENQQTTELTGQDQRVTQPAANRILATLFVGTFAVGCVEMLITGVLDVLARSLSVSVPAAGSLMTASALGLAFGGPTLTALTITVDRRRILIGALAGFIVITTVAVLIANYELFLACRVVAGALQGLFIAAAFTIGPSVVAPERDGRSRSCYPGSRSQRPPAFRSVRCSATRSGGAVPSASCSRSLPSC
jgi:DHA1 family inner membrane transport protein